MRTGPLPTPSGQGESAQDIEHVRGARSAFTRDHIVIAVALVALIVVLWDGLLHQAAMQSSEGRASTLLKPATAGWTIVDAVSTFIMWAVMMAAMMLPSAVPMAWLFTTVVQQRTRGGGTAGQTALLVLGYLFAWAGFSVGATVLQSVLHQTLFLSAGLHVVSLSLGGTILIGAGLYQFTPLKRHCLVHCQSPLQFLLHHWRDGPIGALLTGLHHGAYCVGCCWAVMLVLFVVGIMNTLWIALLAIFVLVERVLVTGPWLSRLAGVACWCGASGSS